MRRKKNLFNIFYCCAVNNSWPIIPSKFWDFLHKLVHKKSTTIEMLDTIEEIFSVKWANGHIRIIHSQGIDDVSSNPELMHNVQKTLTDCSKIYRSTTTKGDMQNIYAPSRRGLFIFMCYVRFIPILGGFCSIFHFIAYFIVIIHVKLIFLFSNSCIIGKVINHRDKCDTYFSCSFLSLPFFSHLQYNIKMNSHTYAMGLPTLLMIGVWLVTWIQQFKHWKLQVFGINT